MERTRNGNADKLSDLSLAGPAPESETAASFQQLFARWNCTSTRVCRLVNAQGICALRENRSAERFTFYAVCQRDVELSRHHSILMLNESADVHTNETSLRSCNHMEYKLAFRDARISSNVRHSF